MKPPPDQQLKWELARERFRIDTPFPPPDQRQEKRIGDILSAILQKDGSETFPLPEKIAERWPVIAGEQLAKHTYPSYLKKGILYINTDHPGWLAELRRLPKAHMLKKISAIPDLPEIKDIRFQLDPEVRTFWK